MPVRVNAKRQPKAGASAAPAAQPFGLPEPPAGRLQKPAGISLCMIVKNEERFLAQCLSSVRDVVDEIIVVDTGSTDATIDIAASFGATVLEREWRDDFAWARNESIAPATKRWIFFLDADEELTAESKPALQQLKTARAYHDAVWVRCYNESDDYRGTGAMSHALIRIFPNCDEIRFRGLIHEFPTVNGSNSGLQGRMAAISIVHHGYLKEIVAERKKGARNLAIVRAAAEREPEDAFHWFNLGSTAFLVNDFEQARDALETMRSINAGRERGFIPNGLSLLSEIYGDKFGDAVRSEAIARECLQLSPRYANAHFQLGKALVAQARYDEAREAYLAAIEDGKFAHLQFVLDDQVYVWKAYSEIGSTYVAQGDEATAAEWFRKGLANAPNVEPLQINLARCLDRQQRYAEAEEVLRSAFETHGDDMTTIDYVNFLLRRGRGLEAVAVVERAHEKLSDEGASALLLAAAQIAEKHGLPNVSYLECAARRTPGSAEILNVLESHYRAHNRMEDLQALLERERLTLPKTHADYLRRSFHALQERRYDDALQLADAGIALCDDPRLRYNAAAAAAALGQLDEAARYVSGIMPAEREPYVAGELLLVHSFREATRDDDAMVAVSRLLAHEPEHVAAILQRAELQERRGDLSAAEESFAHAASLDRSAGVVALASFYLRHQRFEDAARTAERGLA